MTGLLPLLFILAFPIMLIFMMRRMHSGGAATRADDNTQVDQRQVAAPAQSGS